MNGSLSKGQIAAVGTVTKLIKVTPPTLYCQEQALAYEVAAGTVEWSRVLRASLAFP